jgi:hypothetical protein
MTSEHSPSLDSRRASRRRVLGGAVAALCALALAPAAARERSCCAVRIAVPDAQSVPTLAELAEGNAQAMRVARDSRYIMEVVEQARFLASGIPDPMLRAATRGLLDNPAPTYQLRSPAAADREQVRAELLAEGLVPEATRVDGIFPPVADPLQAPQPFWSAPGSGFGAHHAYPGGLAVHETVFARVATSMRDTYDDLYHLSTQPGALDQTRLTGVSLWHDIHKVTVFQWRPDGSELVEQTIADTGAHHPLSGAEAIVRGMSPAWVIAQMSAHDAPTNVTVQPGQTGRQRVVNYLRAAAIIARVDPVAAGLLRRAPDSSYAIAEDPVRIEGYIANLADHDFLFTNDALPAAVQALRQVAADDGLDATREPVRFNLYRNLVLSQLSEVRIYATLLTGGVADVRALIADEVDLTAL